VNPKSTALIVGLTDLARSLVAEGRLDEAEALARRAETLAPLDGRRQSQSRAMVEDLWENIALHRGNARAAISYGRAAVAAAREGWGADNPLLAQMQVSLARTLLGSNPAEAAAQARSAIEIDAKAGVKAGLWLAKAWGALGRAELAQGHAAEARAALTGSVELFEKIAGVDPVEHGTIRLAWAEALWRTAAKAEARAAAQRARVLLDERSQAAPAVAWLAAHR
jgi:tetratricopeptide (TPR) repeat protein